MTSTRGRAFETASSRPVVRTLTDQANHDHTRALPPDAGLGLVTRLTEGSGRGVFVADGFSPHHGAVVGTYRGLFTETLPLSDFALAYLPVLCQGRLLYLFRVLDAAHQCLRGNPDPTHAGLYNHYCEDPTLTATLFWTEGHPLPIVRMVTRTTLRSNSQLTYNYDAHIDDGAYTISADLAAGQPCTPCRCSPAGCPRNRFFPAI
jgi:hypothetical protein